MQKYALPATYLYTQKYYTGCSIALKFDIYPYMIGQLGWWWVPTPAKAFYNLDVVSFIIRKNLYNL